MNALQLVNEGQEEQQQRVAALEEMIAAKVQNESELDAVIARLQAQAAEKQAERARLQNSGNWLIYNARWWERRHPKPVRD